MELTIIDLNKIKAEIQKPLGNGWYWKIFKLNGEWWGAKYQPGQEKVKCCHLKRVQILSYRWEDDAGNVVG